MKICRGFFFALWKAIMFREPVNEEMSLYYSGIFNIYKTY